MCSLPLLVLALILKPGLVISEEVLETCPAECLCDLQHWGDLFINHYIRPEATIENKNYLETNEAETYDSIFLEDNPLTKVVMCVLQPNRSIERFFEEIPSDVEALTVIQGSEPGLVTIYASYLNRFTNLKNLEIKGTTTFNNTLLFALNKPIRSLIYLNLVSIQIERSIVAFDTELFSNEISENVIAAVPMIVLRSVNESNDILPYDVYVAQQKQMKMPLFKGYDDLVLLRISGCHLNELTFEMFDGLNKLRFLYLDDNQFKFIPEFAFYGVPKLEVLSLAKNNLLDISITDLSGLLELQYLDLSSNNFSQLSELSFPPFPNLKVADFRNNPIQMIYSNTFEVMNTTKSIILGNMDTPVILLPNAFIGLIKLEVLQVYNLKIAMLKRDLFRGMKNLLELTLTGNIYEIEYDTFLDLTNLENLILNHCKLETISIDAFFGLEKLQILDLSWNKLTNLPPGLFDPLRTIKEIYLNNNLISVIPELIFHKSPAKLIRLNSNPWHCSCHLRFWLPAVINKIKRTQPKKCSLDYDKGILCEKQSEIEYIYDRRVAPICATPLEYKRMGVFRAVLKKMRCLKVARKNVKLTKKIQEYIGQTELPNQETTQKQIQKSTVQVPLQTVSANQTHQYKATAQNHHKKFIMKKIMKEKHLKKISKTRMFNDFDNMLNNSI